MPDQASNQVFCVERCPSIHKIPNLKKTEKFHYLLQNSRTTEKHFFQISGYLTLWLIIKIIIIQLCTLKRSYNLGHKYLHTASMGNFFLEWSQTRLHCKIAWRKQLLIYSHLWLMIHQPWDCIQHSGLYINLHFQHFVPLKLFQTWLCMGCLGPGHYLFSKWPVDDWSWNDNIQGDDNNSWYNIFLRIKIRFTHSITIRHLCLRKPL